MRRSLYRGDGTRLALIASSSARRALAAGLSACPAHHPSLPHRSSLPSPRSDVHPWPVGVFVWPCRIDSGSRLDPPGHLQGWTRYVATARMLGISPASTVSGSTYATVRPGLRDPRPNHIISILQCRRTRYRPAKVKASNNVVALESVRAIHPIHEWARGRELCTIPGRWVQNSRALEIAEWGAENTEVWKESRLRKSTAHSHRTRGE